MSSSVAEFYTRGRKYLAKAIACDEKKQYEDAVNLYGRACENFVLGIKYDTNPVSKTKVMTKVKSYLSRAELLKVTLAQQRAQRELNQKLVGADHDASSRSLLGGKEKPNPFEGAKGSPSNIKFDDVAGLSYVKDTLKEAVMLPMLQPQLFKGARRPWKGILLYGPPGTGKTLVAQALANEAKVKFVSISAADIMSKHQGDSEKAIRQLFETARANRPCVIFFDEVDSIGGSRSTGDEKTESSRRVLTELLRQLQGVNSDSMDGVTFIGATNLPFDIDPALRRRFEKRIYVPLPDAKARAKVLQLHLGDPAGEHSLGKTEFERAALQTEGYSNSDLAGVAKEALMAPIRKCMNATHFKEEWEVGLGALLNGRMGKYLVPCSPNDRGAKPMRMFDANFDAKRLKVPMVNAKDLQLAIANLRPSVSKENLAMHEKFKRLYGGREPTMNTVEDEPAVAKVPGKATTNRSAAAVASYKEKASKVRAGDRADKRVAS